MIGSSSNHDKSCDTDNRPVSCTETDARTELFNAGLKSFKVTFIGIDDVEFYILIVTKLYA